MSYILDALRKAERERNAGQAAPLAIVTQGGAPQIVQRRPWWPWAIAGVSGAVALSLVIALVMHRRAAHTPEPAPVAAAARAPAAAAPIPDDIAEIPAEEVMGDDGAPPIDQSAKLQSLDDVASDGARAAPRKVAPLQPFDAAAQEPAADEALLGEAPEEQPAAEESIEEISPDDAAQETVEPPLEDDSGDQPVEPQPAAPPGPGAAHGSGPATTHAPPPPPAPTTQVDTVKLEPAPGSAPRPLKEMPSDYRAVFPQLKVEVHVYDDNVAKRWVIVNSRRYREGETLSEGPRVAQIVRDGIVFDFRGAKVLYPR